MRVKKIAKQQCMNDRKKKYLIMQAVAQNKNKKWDENAFLKIVCCHSNDLFDIGIHLTDRFNSTTFKFFSQDCISNEYDPSNTTINFQIISH